MAICRPRWDTGCLNTNCIRIGVGFLVMHCTDSLGFISIWAGIGGERVKIVNKVGFCGKMW